MNAAELEAPTKLAERPTRVRYWVIVFAATLAMITYIDRVALSFAAPFIRRELNISAVQMGWAFACFGWAYAMFEIPGGFLGDWIGPRKVLTRIVVWWSCFTALISVVWSFPALAVIQFLFGAGEAGCFPNVAKAFSTWLPSKERVRAQGIMWLSARWAGAFTPLLVAVIVTHFGWRHAFQLFGSIGVVWAVAFFLWFRDNPLEKRSLNAGERELLKANAGLGSGHAHVPWRKFLRARQVWMLCGQFFCLNYGWYFYITWMPSYLREARHLALTSSALLSILPLFCGGLGNPACVFLSRIVTRRTGSVARARRLMAYLGFGGAATFLALSTFVYNPLLAMLCIGAASFSNDLVMPGAWTASMDVGGRFAGTLGGTMNMCGNIGGALAPLAIGYMLTWSHSNWNLTFYVSAAVYAMGMIFWRFLDPVTPIEA
jgi:MFS family permease